MQTRYLILLALCALASRAGAEPPLHYQCSTTMSFGPSHCPGTIPSMQDHSRLELDFEHKLWKADRLVGPIDTDGDVVTLHNWGAGMVGRDATLNRGSGAFNYHHESGCLVETQTGTCQPAAAPQ